MMQTCAPPGASLEDASEGVLAYQIAKASAFVSVMFDRTVAEPLELRPLDYATLIAVSRQEKLTAAAIAEEFAISRPYMSICVERLVARGLVERRENPADRRSQWLQPTSAGRALAAKATTLLIKSEQRAFRLSRRERDNLCELLRKVAATKRQPSCPGQ
jgi:DNA-binding MarR family transcriptional regulator